MVDILSRNEPYSNDELLRIARVRGGFKVKMKDVKSAISAIAEKDQERIPHPR